VKLQHLILAALVTVLAGGALWLLRPSGPLSPTVEVDAPTQALVCAHYVLVSRIVRPGECVLL
jgi:hypothetical protein